jgi:glycine C-acetyltransferase
LLLEKGVFVVGFSYPVVPKGAARIRCQISASHTQQQLEAAVAAFVAVREQTGQVDGLE